MSNGLYIAVGTKTQHQCIHDFLSGVLAVFRSPTTVLVITLLCSLGSVRVAPAQEPIDEYALKAAFLYNFAKFIEWPVTSFADSTSPFSLCVLGSNPFGANLETLARKPVRERTLVIKHIHANTALSGCHILYVGPQELHRLEALLHHLEKAPVLTVCDTESCAESGLMLNMRMAENRMQLDMNLDAVQRTPLKVSSQLIKLTRIVKRNE
jgi:YfiR/HmsC-like